ncbi:MAG: hypothetical protein NTV51_03875 [Verrucomicrobia bacterium]|nr:hypothetical protein [Verrucomicrobiota bacterium]
MPLISTYLTRPLRRIAEVSDDSPAASYKGGTRAVTSHQREGPRENGQRLSTAEVLVEIGHKLRTPLTAVVGFSELMLQGSLSDAKKWEYTNDIHDAGVQLAGAIDDVIELVRADTAVRVERRAQAAVEPGDQLPPML